MPIFRRYETYGIEIDENGLLSIVYPGTSSMIVEGTIHLKDVGNKFGINVNDEKLKHGDRVKPGRSVSSGFQNCASIHVASSENSSDCYKVYDYNSSKEKENAEAGYYITMALYPLFAEYFKDYSKDYFDDVLKPEVTNFVNKCRSNPKTIAKEAKKAYIERNKKEPPTFNEMIQKGK